MMRFTGELLSKDGKHMGRWDGGHVVDTISSFLGSLSLRGLALTDVKDFIRLEGSG